jgi:heme exporter protein CcmD
MEIAQQELFVTLSYAVSALVIFGLIAWAALSARAARARVAAIEAKIATPSQAERR